MNYMKSQVDIPDELNKKLKVYRIENDLKDIQEAIIQIVKKFFDGVKKHE